MIRIFILLILVPLCVSANSLPKAAVAAEEVSLTIVGHEFEPFYYSSGTSGIQGACYDIIKKFCDEEKYHCKFKIASLREALRMLKDGRADLGCPLGSTIQRETVYYFLQNVFKTTYSFFALPEVAKKVRRYEDLTGLKVSVISPSLTEVSLRRVHEYLDKKFKIVPESTVSDSLRKAENKSSDALYANTDVAKIWIKKNRSKLVEIPYLGEPTTYGIAFTKKKFTEEQFQKSQQQLRRIFDEKNQTLIGEKYHLKISLSDEATPAPTEKP